MRFRFSRAVKWWPYILVVAASFFAVAPLFNSGFFVFHDIQQVVRLHQLDKSLLAGQLPVRWVADLGFGYGYPLFNFYPPLVYYLGELFHLLIKTSFVDSIKLVWLVAIVGSGLAMYVFGRHLFGVPAGLTAAILYIYAPYHAVDAYVRGALAELFSFVWLPLILLFSYKFVTHQEWRDGLWTGILLSLLMLTHNLVFLSFFGLWSLWVFGLWLVYRANWRRSLFLYLGSCLLAFALAAFFWLPALGEKKETLVDSLLVRDLASYQIHFVCPGQWWESPWGYGGSTAGCDDGMSFRLGRMPIVLAIATGVGLGLRFLKKRTEKRDAVLALTGFLLATSLFLMTEYAAPLWGAISFLWYLQFPWRLLEFAALFLSIFAAGLVFFLPWQVGARIGAFIVILAIFSQSKHFSPQTYLSWVTDKELTREEEIKWNVSATSFEYLPSRVATNVTKLGTTGIDITKEEVAKNKWQSVSGEIAVSAEEFLPHRFTLETASPRGGELQINVTNFPGWRVAIDGRPVAVEETGKLRLLTFAVPEGRHVVTGRFADTPVRTWGNAISLVSGAGVGVLVLYGRFFEKTKLAGDV